LQRYHVRHCGAAACPRTALRSSAVIFTALHPYSGTPLRCCTIRALQRCSIALVLRYAFIPLQHCTAESSDSNSVRALHRSTITTLQLYTVTPLQSGTVRVLHGCSIASLTGVIFVRSYTVTALRSCTVTAFRRRSAIYHYTDTVAALPRHHRHRTCIYMYMEVARSQ
jgi:hypothetical protein